MVETLLLLTHLTIVLLFGILFTVLARRLKVPYVLLLLLAGIMLGYLRYNGEPLISFPPIFTNSIGVLALVLVVFDASSRFKWKQFDSLTVVSSKLAITFLLFNIAFMTIVTTIVFQMENVFIALMFAALMSGTSADVVLSMFKEKSNKVTDLLEVESIINTPIVVLLPFIILSIMKNVGNSQIMFLEYFSELYGVLQQFVTGIGAGVITGLLIFKIMRKFYSHKLSPLILITSTFLTYILAENLNGSGVIAVTVLGLFFGNLYVKQKQILFEFSSTFSNSLMILVFVLVGIGIQLPFNDFAFIYRSVLLFLVYVAIRSMTVYVSTLNENFTTKEKIFLTLNVPKGIAAAVLVFSLLSYTFAPGGLLSGEKFINVPGAETMLNLTLAFILYSLVLATAVNHFSKFFIKLDVSK